MTACDYQVAAGSQFPWLNTHERGKQLAENGYAFSAWNADKLLGVAGISRLWPGVGEAWAVVTDAGRARPLMITRAVRSFLRGAEHGFKRVHADVYASFDLGRRWAEAVGFRLESVMRCAAPDGSDLVRYVLLNGDGITGWPRPMRPEEADAVRALYGRCHPGWPAWRPEAYTVLVLDGPRGLVGYAAFSVAPAPVNMVKKWGEVGYGRDLAVDPDYRGLGLGLSLHRARLEAIAAAGAHTFIGATAPDNGAMARVFELTGAKPQNVVPSYFPDGSGAVVYAGPTKAD